MPLHFQCRFTDDQLAAIDAAAHVTDARTGMTTTLTRQQVVLAIVEAWRMQQPPPLVSAAPPSTPMGEPEPSLAAIGRQAPDQTPPADRKAALAMRVHAMRAAQMSFAAIAARWNDEQVPTLSGNGKWGKGSVERLAKVHG